MISSVLVPLNNFLYANRSVFMLGVNPNTTTENAVCSNTNAQVGRNERNHGQDRKTKRVKGRGLWKNRDSATFLRTRQAI